MMSSVLPKRNRFAAWLRARAAWAVLLWLVGVLAVTTPAQAAPDWASNFTYSPGADLRINAFVETADAVFAGGDFQTIGGVAAHNVARYDKATQTWSALGAGAGSDASSNGVDGAVNALAVIGNDLYVGGFFSMAAYSTSSAHDRFAASNIAKWDMTTSTWSAVGSPTDGVSFGSGGDSTGVKALAVSGSNLYVGGNFTIAGGISANRIAKWDGSSWSALGSPTNGVSGGTTPIEVNVLAVSGSNLYVGGRFTSAGGNSANNIAKWDGTSWSALGSPTNGVSVGSTQSVNALLVNGSDLYVGGGFSAAGGVAANGIAKWDGTSWSALGSGANNGVKFNTSNGVVNALALSGSTLYVGGTFNTVGGSTVTANAIARWNTGTSTWSTIGANSALTNDTFGNRSVRALAVIGSDLFLGGTFNGATNAAGTISCPYIIGWNGSDWKAIGAGDGMNNPVLALVDAGSVVYAGGTFTTAGGLAANRVACWNKSTGTWSSLGGGASNGVSGQVNAVAVSGSNVYVGGFFSTAGGVAVSSIAKWDGTSWSALGTGVNGTVYALAVSGSDLYVGGSFQFAGSVPVNSIAKWDGTSWKRLGSPSAGVFGGGQTVRALAVSGSDLYVGGNFTSAGAVSANGIAKWDGTSWSALGAGLSGSSDGNNTTAFAMAVNGSDVYVGGNFTNAGAVSANGIAKWNPTPGWSALGSGVDDTVDALAVWGNDLFVGGLFTNAGGSSANRVAKWSGTAWSALGSPTNGVGGVIGTVYALAVSNSESALYEGSNVTTAGGKVSAYIGSFSPLPYTLSINDVVVTEGDAGTTNAVFTVTLSPASTSNVTVDYAIANDTTTASDYDTASDSDGGTPGTLTITAGNTSGTITVPINSDTTVEPDETFFVNLSNAANADIGDDQGVGTITNDDETPSLTVTTTSDLDAADNLISLREAIAYANTLTGPSTISFNIPNTDPGLSGGVFTIAPTSPLPAIIKPVIIDGYSQTGAGTSASANTNDTSSAINAHLVIEIDGTNAGMFADGLTIGSGGEGSTIKGLIINNFATGNAISLQSDGNTVEGNFLGTDATGTMAQPNVRGVLCAGDFKNNTIGGTTAAARNLISGNTDSGIRISNGANNNLVQGNFIGTDATGTVALGNTNRGIELSFGAHDNTIGGTTTAARNLISGNGLGIQLTFPLTFPTTVQTANNLVQGNYIGTNAAGTAAVGNGQGVNIAAAQDNTIGGTAPGAGNVIAGNNANGGTNRGIEIVGHSQASTTGNVIQGNKIGTAADGTTDLGHQSAGILIWDGNGNTVSNNTIGGTAPGAGNIIAFNGKNNFEDGVTVGTNAGDTSTGTAIRGNSIFSNGALGIDLGNDGVTANETNDGDGGPNNRQNFPIITNVSTAGGNTTVTGTLNSTTNTSFTLDFYDNAAADPSGNGEGKTYLGSDTVTTTGNDASFSKTLTGFALPAGHVITVTATDPNGNTSEFSLAAALSNVAPVNTVPAGPLNATEDVSLAITGISVDDADAGAAELTVTLSVNDGTLTLLDNVAGGLTTADIMDNGTATVTINASQSAINATLADANGLTYLGDLNFNGGDTLTVTTDDNGHTGSGGALSDQDMVTINVAAANDAPVNTVPGTQTTTENTNLILSGLSVRDVDAGTANLTLTLDVDHGTLTLLDNVAGGLTTGDIMDNGTATVTVNASQAAINATLADASGLVYHGTAGFRGMDTLTVTTNDKGNTGGAARSDMDTVTINVQETPSLIVTTSSDTGTVFDGLISLREAIAYANLKDNAKGGPDTISFNILPAGAKTIMLSNSAGALPTLGEAVVVDGVTQPGTAPLPRITVDGTNIVATVNGLTINSDGCALHGLKIQKFKGHGVAISGNNNVVGVALNTTGAKNFLFDNGGDGISVLSGTGNVLRANGFQNNGGQPIDLDDDDTTDNDAVPDGDDGANDLQNFPVLSSAVVGVKTSVVSGTLHSAPNRTYRLNFYRSADTTQAAFFPVSSAENVTTDDDGVGSFSVSIGTNVAQRFWRANVTDVLSGDSSELGVAIPSTIDTTPPTVTVDAKKLINGQPFGAVSGTVTDNNPGAQVSFRLRCLATNTWWDGATPTGHWLSTETILPATVTGNAVNKATWTSSGNLPTADDLIESDYVIYATATDDAGNQGLGHRTVAYGQAPSVEITEPGGQGNPLEISELPAVRGTASDGTAGSTESGLKQVLLNIIRSDNKYWTGSTWGGFTNLATTTNPVSLNGAHSATWERTSGLPSVTNDPMTTPGLEVGKTYILRVTATDRSGKQKTATRKVKIVRGNESSGSMHALVQGAPSASLASSAAQLSGATASASSGSVTLEFKSAAPQGDFAVTVGGAPVKLTGTQREGNSVTLLLPDGSLKAGDKVGVSWNGGQATATAE